MSRWLLFCLPLVLPAQEASSLYESKVRPILRTQCAPCHSERNMSSGLSLITRERLLEGGNRGPVLHATHPDQSLLLQVVKQEGALKMPPGRKLSDEQIAVLESWVKDGAPMPTPLMKSTRPGADHWSFQPVKAPAIPAAAKDFPATWSSHPIDRFVAARLQEKQLAPAPEADKATLLRRASLDLIGLPPTTAELTAFLQDKRPDAWQRVVDRLLASPHYGERQARLWLDLARYADTDGYTIDAPRDIWKYRDWVIQALNADMPFDQFVTEQLAGDLLPKPSDAQLIATGFHRNTPSNFEGGIDFEQYRVEAVADRVNTNGSVFLGMTLGCARCHDHKYDPLSQREYYQLFAIFNNIDEVDKEDDRKLFNKPFLELGTAEQRKAFAEWEAKTIELDARLRKHLESITGDAMMDPTVKAMQAELRAFRKTKPSMDRTMIMRELPQPRESWIHLGGDFTRRGVAVQAATPSILPPMTKRGPRADRLDFARWLFRPDHPLTARVTVNRVWQKLFGQGIVDTENDLGLQGGAPSHPELLDWLALGFQQQGWSMKQLHRTIVTSAAYRQSSAFRKDAFAVDPDNRLLARQSRLPLDAEIIRDSALVASGLFAPAIGGASVYPPMPKGANNVTQVTRPWETSKGADRYRRGMYTFIQRSAPHPALSLFDAPEGTVTCTRRARSNSPLQALMLLNDESSLEFSAALAARLEKEGGSLPARLRYLYKLALSRTPQAAEEQRISKFLRSNADWKAIARALLNTDEFLTRP
jgi:hypothetical protein